MILILLLALYWTNIQASIISYYDIKRFRVKNIICKAINHVQGRFWKSRETSQVIYPEESMGEKIAFASIRPTVIEHFSFSEDYSIFEIKIPSNYIGKNLRE